jgi:hypothetical protein
MHEAGELPPRLQWQRLRAAPLALCQTSGVPAIKGSGEVMGRISAI